MFNLIFGAIVTLPLIIIVIISRVRKPIKVALLVASILAVSLLLSYISGYFFDEMSFAPSFCHLFSLFCSWPLMDIIIPFKFELPIYLTLGAICGIIQCSVLGYVVAWVLVKTKVWKV